MPVLECHRLFFALTPPPRVRAAIATVRESAAVKTPMRDDRLHMTLLLLPDMPALPEGLVAALHDVATAVAAAPFDIVLDRLCCTRGTALLLPHAPDAALAGVQSALAARADAIGLAARAGYRFSPHVTLGYAPAAPCDHAIAPIRWTVTDFVAIDSWVGLTRYEEVGRWPLREGR